MQNSNFQLILTEPNGNYAIPDLVITNDFETTFSVNAAADIAQRKDSLSKNISLPGTKNNNRIFNNLYSFNRESNADIAEVLFANYSPNIGVKATMYENNFPVLVGTLKINDVSRDRATGAFTYTGVITGKTVSFFSDIKDVLLTDLPNFDDVITYTWPNIQDSWIFSDAKKFVIPMIDYGKGIVQRADKFDLRNLRPGIYLREYVKRILASKGYTYTSAYIDSDNFKRAYIPFSDQEFATVKFGDFAAGTGGGVSEHLLDNGDQFDGFGVKFQSFVSNQYITKTSKQVNVINDVGNNFNAPNADVFRFNKFTNTSVRMSFNYDIAFNNATQRAFFYLMQVDDSGGGQFISSQVGADKTVISTGDSHKTGTVSFVMPLDNYPAGYQFTFITVVYELNISASIDMNQVSTSINFGNTDASVGSSFSVDLGDTFVLSDAVPKNQKATDFLKSILQFYNMYMMENPDKENDFIVEPYDTFYAKAMTPASYALNWSSKIDQRSIHMKIDTALPKSYAFKFKEDTDYYNTLYKNSYNNTYGNATIDNPSGSADVKNIEVTFSPTVIVKESVDDKTMPAIFTGEVTDKKSFKSNLRILFNNDTRVCSAYDIALTNPGDPPTYDVKVSGVTTCQLSHHVLTVSSSPVFNLLFGLPEAVYYTPESSVFTIPTIYDLLYKKQLAELNDENIFTLEVDCHLTESDISNLDLRTPIFIATKQGYSYFKIILVTYYSSIEVSPVVLQKIIL